MLFEYADDDQEIGVKMPKGSVNMLFTPDEAKLAAFVCQVLENAYTEADSKALLKQLQSRIIRGDNAIQ